MLSCGLRGLSLWLDFGGLVFGEGAYVAPKSFVGCIGCARAATEVVGDDFGSSWGWEGWPLIYDRGYMGVASDGTNHTPIPI